MAIRFVPISLDKPRRLRMDCNAMADAEGVLDMGVARMMGDDMMGFRVLRALLWAGLRWEDRGLTLDRAGQLINTYRDNGGVLTDIGLIVSDAVTAAGWFNPVDDTSGASEDSEGNSQGA